MSAAEEIDHLLSNAVDGALSEDQQTRLGSLLQAEPSTRETYLDYMVLDSLLQWEKPRPVLAKVQQPTKRLRQVSWVLTACLFLAVGVGLFLLLPSREVTAKSDVVERLADWNLAIVDAETTSTRQARFQEKDAAFVNELAKAKLSEDERRLAHSLHVNARALAKEENMLTMAERLDELAEQVHEWLQTHPDADPRQIEALDRHYLKMTDRCLGLIQRLNTTEIPDKVKKKNLDKVSEKIANRAEVRMVKRAEKPTKKPER